MKRFFIVVALLCALPCVAQQGTVAALTGRITSSGQPLPGALVTITSNSLQGNRVTVSGENGGYLFLFLPPGDYLLSFEREGFMTIQQRVRLELASTSRVDVEMTAAPLREIINVGAERPRVPDQLSIATNVRATDLQRLPLARDIRSAVQLSPNVNMTNGKLMIAGAPSWDGLFLVDGVVVNDNLTGQPHNLFIEDAIEEIAVLSGAISAEYGRFTGGVISTITKSGGNQYDGSLRDQLTNAAWTAGTPWPVEPTSLDKVNHAIESTLGGFLIKDRLWFFVAGRRAANTLRKFTFRTNVPYENSADEQRWEGKLTAELSARQSIVASYVNSLIDERNAAETRSSGQVLSISSLIPERWQPSNLFAATYEGVVTTNTSAEVHASRKRYAFRGNGGPSSDPIAGTLIQVRSPAATMNAPLGCGICGDDARDNTAWNAKMSRYLDTRLGNHTLIGGAEEFREERLNHGMRSSSGFNVQIQSAQIVGDAAYPIFDPSANTLIVWNVPLGGGASHLNARGAYVNDRWDVTSRLSANLGLRYDRNHAIDGIGRFLSNDSGFSPRLSATFDLRNDGRQRLLASYARYGAKMFEEGADPQQVGVFALYGWRYRGAPINTSDPFLSSSEALARLFQWFDSIGGVQSRPLSFTSDPRISNDFDGRLKSPSVDERSVGYSLQLPRGYARAEYVMRDWHHFYATRVDTTTGQRVDPFSGKPIDVARVVNDDSGTVRNYRAVQLESEWQSGRASAGARYTWSKLRGNDDEEEGAVSAPRNLPQNLYYPEFLGYAERRPIGYLKQDQRYRARVWFSYGERLRASIVQWFDSGSAYSASGDVDPKSGYDGVPVNPGYAFNQVSTGPYYFSSRGAFRTDDVFSTDVAITYERPLGATRLFVKSDVLNLFNNSAVIAPDTQVLTRLSAGNASGLQPFNPFTQKPVEGVNYRLSPTFGKATGPDSYQTPRTFRIEFGARF